MSKANSVLGALRDELQIARRHADDRDRLAAELETIREQCADYKLVVEQLSNLRQEHNSALENLRTDGERLEANKKTMTVMEKDLKRLNNKLRLKENSLARIQKQLAWERRMSKTMENKVRETERQLRRKGDEAVLHRDRRIKAETDLDEREKALKRERALRLIDIHQSQRLQNRDMVQMKNMSTAPTENAYLKERVTVLSLKVETLHKALTVEQTMREDDTHELENQFKKSQELTMELKRAKAVTKIKNDDCRAWKQRFKALQDSFNRVQQLLVTGASLRGNDSVANAMKASAVSKVVPDFETKAPPYPLGTNWGLAGDFLNPASKHAHAPTHTSLIRMRGRNPEQVVMLLRNALAEARDKKETLQSELQKTSAESADADAMLATTRELLFQARVERSDMMDQQSEMERRLAQQLSVLQDERSALARRNEVYKKRRQREREEKDPYKVPKELRADYVPMTLSEAASLVQACYKAKRIRQKFRQVSLMAQAKKEADVAKLKSDIEVYAPALSTLDRRVETLEAKVKATADKAAKLAAKKYKLESSYLPKLGEAIKLKVVALQRAEAEALTLRRDVELRLPNKLPSTLTIPAALSPSIELDTSAMIEPDARESKSVALSLAQGAGGSLFLERQEKIDRERGWRGGGGGQPRFSVLRPCDVPYAMPLALPKRQRKRRERQFRNALGNAPSLPTTTARLPQLGSVYSTSTQVVEHTEGKNGLSSMTSTTARPWQHPTPASSHGLRLPKCSDIVVRARTTTGRTRVTPTSGLKNSTFSKAFKAYQASATVRSCSQQRPRTTALSSSRPSTKRQTGSLYVGHGLGVTKAEFSVTRDEVQSHLKLPTTGSAKHVIERIRSQINAAAQKK